MIQLLVVFLGGLLMGGCLVLSKASWFCRIQIQDAKEQGKIEGFLKGFKAAKGQEWLDQWVQQGGYEQMRAREEQAS